MNLARAVVNDSFQGGAGRILTNDAPFTVPFINEALEELQQELENNGVTTFTVDNWLLQPTAVPNPDPSTQVSISFTGYFDGTGNYPNPALPPDLLMPLELWERQTGTTLAFSPMSYVDVLDSQMQDQFLRVWTWNQDSINMIGSTLNQDIRMRYKSSILAPIPANADLTKTTVNCLGSKNAIAYTIAYNYASARGAGPALAALANKRDKAVFQMVNRYVRAMQAQANIRDSFGTEESFVGGNINY